MAREQILHGNILIQLGPMDAMAAAYQLPPCLLSRSSMVEARKPRHRYRYRATVRQVHDKSTVNDTNVLGQGLSEIMR
jgi:hypothetical protein